MSALLIVLALLLCAVPAALVLVYVAYPQRGEELPGRFQWLGKALVSGRERLPVLTEEDGDRVVASRR
ncbi:hypothetical protein GCM10011584_12720 [Nocardioides phosphati]|uniref:Uncharacterized protein n=1 Tax=Nocardioides phosphati TaxID=1867775 RepID=A0ABQ2N8Z8_9ACTN|nr:hypothetical protein [Nocardioides phosphati]GGO87632.1 hypothetical protein GCM10011584_12720 [Nocardioides phosphati]